MEGSVGPSARHGSCARAGYCLSCALRFLPRYGGTGSAARGKVSRKTGDRINCNRLITENEHFRLVARELDLEFTTSGSSRGQPFSTPPHCDDLQRIRRMIQVEENDSYRLVCQFGRKQILPAPDCRQMDALKQWIFFNRTPRPRSNVATLSVNRSILEDRCSLGLSAQAVGGLHNRFPSPSARRMIITKQALVLVLFVQLLVAMAFFSTPAAFLLQYLTATPLYLGCIALRILAAMLFDGIAHTPPLESEFDRSRDHTLPTYSILVPLYVEHGQIGNLVSAFADLDWPR